MAKFQIGNIISDSNDNNGAILKIVAIADNHYYYKVIKTNIPSVARIYTHTWKDRISDMDYSYHKILINSVNIWEQLNV